MKNYSPMSREGLLLLAAMETEEAARCRAKGWYDLAADFDRLAAENRREAEGAEQ